MYQQHFKGALAASAGVIVLRWYRHAQYTFCVGRWEDGQMSMAGPKADRSSMKKVRCIPSMAEASGEASDGLQGGPL